jgi:hypothetical protein
LPSSTTSGDGFPIREVDLAAELAALSLLALEEGVLAPDDDSFDEATAFDFDVDPYL